MEKSANRSATCLMSPLVSIVLGEAGTPSGSLPVAGEDAVGVSSPAVPAAAAAEASAGVRAGVGVCCSCISTCPKAAAAPSAPLTAAEGLRRGVEPCRSGVLPVHLFVFLVLVVNTGLAEGLGAAHFAAGTAAAAAAAGAGVASPCAAAVAGLLAARLS